MDSFQEINLRQPHAESLSGSCGILIPAFNEEASIASIVDTALASQLGPVLVVNDGSEDLTAERAFSAGANVLSLADNQGKGGAVYAGIRCLKTDVVVLIDADLTGLTLKHLHDLAEPVMQGQFDMSRGVFTGGRWQTTTAQKLAPYLNGQRAIRRSLLLDIPRLKESRYGLEIIITEKAKRDAWKSKDIPLTDVSQIMKEEKRGFWKGLSIRLGMYRDIVSTWLRNLH